MWSARLLIAAGVAGVMGLLCLLAFIANGYTQIRTTGTYTPPQSLIDLIKLAFAASVAVLYLGGSSEVKRLTSEDRKDDQLQQEKTCGCTGECAH